VHIYIGFETLKVKCTQYGIRSQAAFKNARAMFFSFSGGAGSCFRVGLKKSRAGAEISREGGPRPDLTPPIVRRGYLVSAIHYKEVQKFLIFWTADRPAAPARRFLPRKFVGGQVHVLRTLLSVCRRRTSEKPCKVLKSNLS
jgi:hypothetical protein